MSIGERIREARQAKGLTQQELGEILGVQKSAVAKYENGRIINIKRSTLKKLSEALDIPPAELVIAESEVSRKSTINDGLSENQRQIVALIRLLSDDQLDGLLKLLQAMSGDS